MEASKRMQNRYTRLLPGLESISYTEQLKKLGLSSLEHRGLRGGLICIYNFEMHRYDK